MAAGGTHKLELQDNGFGEYTEGIYSDLYRFFPEGLRTHPSQYEAGRLSHYPGRYMEIQLLVSQYPLLLVVNLRKDDKKNY